MKLIVVGCGFVGETIASALEEEYFDIARIDPKYYKDTICDHCDADGIIICVNTPTENGKCDDTNIRNVLMEIGSACHVRGGLMHLPVLLKSTVTPDLLETYPENVTYSPEFLRANTAKKDFDREHLMVFGGTKKDTRFWAEVFSFHQAKKKFTDRKTASMIKYMHNTWLAMKVAYFHEIYYNMNGEYDHNDMIDILGTFSNIGTSHMQAPNEEMGLGYGGYCFPKDTEAFLEYTDSEILKAVHEVNNKLRNKTIK